MYVSMRQLIATPIFVVLFGAIACSSSPQAPGYGSEDGKKIALLIEDLNEKKASNRELRQLFDTPPQNLNLYDRYMYDIQGNPAIQGDEARVTVAIRNDNDTVNTTKEWTFVRRQGTWKIQQAPLP
ncbi:MAG: hypothetical protein RMJ88_14510 [Thermogemmata sp.]|nr:hypothetical protein [Thermogemmata sp.]